MGAVEPREVEERLDARASGGAHAASQARIGE
jgi:hypothetical protein